MANIDIKQQIKQSIQACSNGDLTQKALSLFKVLGYNTARQAQLDKPTFVTFKDSYIDRQSKFNEEKALTREWKYVDLLFQLSKEEVQETASLFDTKQVDRTVIETYLFFVIELSKEHYTRTELSLITREVNRLFPMPVMILFKHGQLLTLSVIDRRLHKRDESKDVLEKVTLIKDIQFENPHRAHLEILFDLSFDELQRKIGFTNFVELHNAWKKTLDIKELNKRFFQELANWYFWASKKVVFPDDAEKDKDIRNATNVIRLITRLMFVWFLKEKSLIPEPLFDEKHLKKLLKYTDDRKSTYYKAILQNLFFATLNTEMGKRRFRIKNDSGRDGNYFIHNVFRYENEFVKPKETLEQYFAPIPFLNGGLFECLDKELDDKGKLKRTRIDGFSDRDDNVLRVPDEIFFCEKEKEIDLNEIYGTKNKSYKVRGLIDILNSYKFTITENTPIEEEVALDPELLGKVFENLLANYNPETGATARKQTGSFYTPREIVDYMVDESLVTYMENRLAGTTTYQDKAKKEDLNAGLYHLLAYNEEPHKFSEKEVKLLIETIDALKILDPACGSGAFPMGILHKLVFILGKLDPGNERWKTTQISKLEDVVMREELERVFRENYDDYGRKLYLIENCIYGVDIQPIAVQIAKLRFFISLIVDQKLNDAHPNRGIRPLPNLETKFVAANTLLSINKAQGVLRNPEISRKEGVLKHVRDLHFSAKTPATKHKWREEDVRLRKELSDLFKSDGFKPEVAQMLASWDPYDQNTSANFFDPEWMFGVMDGFDVLIGNPPYIKEPTLRSAFDGLRESPYYQGKMDLWYFFACMGLDMLRSKTGVLTFIATNNWITNAGASILRNKIVSDATILHLLDFGNFKIFESADIQTMILACVRNNTSPVYDFDLRKIDDPQSTFDIIVDLLNKKPSQNIKYLCPRFDRQEMKGKFFSFSDDAFQNILINLSKQANFILNKSSEVAQGIVAPQDAVNKASKIILGRNVEIGDGIFILSSAEKKAKSFGRDELKFIKPFYTTAELHKYYGSPKNSSWVIYTDSSFKNPFNIKPFPNIKKHLDQFKDVITSDNYPYGLHRSRDEKFFLGEKIISARKCAEPTFTYTDFDCYVSQTFNVIKSNRINMKCLTGMLNSKLIKFWLKHRGKMQGHQFQIDKEPLLSIPLKLPDAKQQGQIEKLVEKIIVMKQTDVPAVTSEFESKIDELVYKLYGLTPEEVAIVEGKN